MFVASAMRFVWDTKPDLPTLHASSVGSLETLLDLKTLSAIHLSKRTSNSFGMHGMGGGLSYSLPFDFFLFSLVDTVMACGVGFRSLVLSELGLTN